MGCAEGQSPFAGSLRVSLRYSFPSFLYQEGVGRRAGRVFPQPARYTDLCEGEPLGVPALGGAAGAERTKLQ